MSLEAVRQRRFVQEWLDEFVTPEGARVSRLVKRSGRWIPALDFVVARLVVAGANEVRDEWIFEVIVDPNLPGTDSLDLSREWRFWTDGLVINERFEHTVFEGPIMRNDGEVIPDEFVRAVPGITHLKEVEAAGGLERMREHIAEQWSTSLPKEVA